MLPAPLLAAIGASTGLLAGIIGAGGGVATLMLLVAFGLDPHVAVGTSLLFSVGIGGGGSLAHHRQGTADPLVALALGIPAAVTAVAGAHLNSAVPDWALTVGAAGLAGASALAVLTRTTRADASERDGSPLGLVLTRRWTGREGTYIYHVRLGLSLLGGGAIGLAQGLLGVGGGFLFVPVMVHAMGMPERVAVGSSLFAIMIGGLSGGMAHALRGTVDLGSLALLLPFGLVGVLGGARASRKLPGHAIRRVFAAALIVTATVAVVRSLS